MEIESYDDIPVEARRIIDEIWKQNKDIFESMDRKEMVNQIFDFMIEELTEKIEDWKD
jgi:predicted secreted protein